MSLAGWLQLRTARALVVTGAVAAAVAVVAWGRMLTMAGQPWPTATVFLLSNGMGLMVACLVSLLLDGDHQSRSLPLPRFLKLLPLLELPVLALLGIILRLSGHATGATWGLAIVLPVVAQVIMLVAWALSVWVVVPLVRALAGLISRPRHSGVRAGSVAGALLILTVVGGVLFVAGTMLAGLSPTGAGTRAGLLRSALRALWSDTGGSQIWAWVGRFGLILLLLGGTPLVLARRG